MNGLVIFEYAQDELVQMKLDTTNPTDHEHFQLKFPTLKTTLKVDQLTSTAELADSSDPSGVH